MPLFELRTFSKIFFLISLNLSSDVFRENLKYIAISLASLSSKNLTFSNICVITEGMDLKLRVCVYYPESNPYYQRRQFLMLFFFLRFMSPFSSYTFYPLSSTPQPSVGTHMWCSCLNSNMTRGIHLR